MLTISWSSLSYWTICRAKAHYVAQGKSNNLQNTRNFLAGNTADKLMRAWLANPNRRPNEMASLVDLYIDKCIEEGKENKNGVVKWRNASDRKEITAFCVELVTRLEPILNRYVIPYEFEVAKRFSALLTLPYLDGSLVDIRLIGELDLLVKVNGEYVIWDLKGTANNGYWRKTLGQLIFYDISMYALYGKFPVRVGLFQPMCDNQVLNVQVKNEDRAQMLGRISSMCESIWKQDFTPKVDSEGCAYCQVRHVCSRYTKALNLGVNLMDAV